MVDRGGIRTRVFLADSKELPALTRSMMDVRPRLALGSVDLQTTGSTTSPCARCCFEMVPSAGSAPAPSRPQRGVLLLHHEGGLKLNDLELKVDPPAGVAPAWTCLRDRRLSTSATEESEFVFDESGAACRCCPDAPGLEDRHACCYINAAIVFWKVGRWSWYRANLVGFSTRCSSV